MNQRFFFFFGRSLRSNPVIANQLISVVTMSKVNDLPHIIFTNRPTEGSGVQRCVPFIHMD